MTTPSVFLVEDNEMDAQLALRTLRKLGLADETRILRDGREALDALLEPELPRLVLLDLNLPHTNGVQVLQWIRAEPRTRSLPVAILTGTEQDRQVIDIYKLGVSAYFIKPLEAGELARLLAKLDLPHTVP